MFSNVSLTFTSESALESFIWQNLAKLLGFNPIAQQYYVEGQTCDILAVNSTRQLVVIELKNTEDRYIVQQLTRYCHSLKTYLTFAEQVDYSKPIHLLAIAPLLSQTQPDRSVI